MNQDDDYYLMPADNAKAFIPGLYTMALDAVNSGLSGADKPDIAESTRSLVNKINELPAGSDFRMTFTDCVLMYGILVKVKIMFHTVRAKIEYEREASKTEDLRLLFRLTGDLGKFMDDVLDDLCETFAAFGPEIERFRNDLHKLELPFRTMEADNEESVICFHLKTDMERRFFLLVFQVFDIAIFRVGYEFSATVREADFFYEADFKDVYKRLKEATGEEATGGEEITELNLTLRDAIVVYTTCNITQKLFLTDAGDHIMVIFNKVTAELNNGMSGTDLRSMYLQTAARINEAIEEGVIDEETFETYIQPVKEFAL